MRILASVGLVAAFATSAFAQKVEYVKTVTASPLSGSDLAAVGPRYIRLSQLIYDGDKARVDVLDLASLTVTGIETKRALLEQRFGLPDPSFQTLVPVGELVALDHRRAGMHLSDGVLSPTRRHWYAEFDPKTGTVRREKVFATTDGKQQLYVIGTDVQYEAMWFYVEQYAAPTGADYKRLAGPTEIVFRRLDLETLAVTDAMKLPLPARPMKSGYEDRLMVHHAADFSRFAVVEYDEDQFKTRPAAKVHFVDPLKGAAFSVPAMDTTYGVAFSRDGKYAFLASAQANKVARVDCTKQKIDKTATGPTWAHHAVVSPNGSQLFVFATGKQVVVYDAPTLTGRTDITHAAETIDAFAQLHGGGTWSAEGTYFVVPEALPPGPMVTVGVGPPKRFLITRLVD